MVTKKLTIQGETVDYAILSGLKQIGLDQEKTVVRILQRERQSIFGYRRAVVSIIYDEGESQSAIHEKKLFECTSRFQFRFDVGIAQLKVPSLFYTELDSLSEEEKLQLLTDFLAKQHIEDPDPEALNKIITDPQSQYTFVPVKTLDCIELNQRGAQLHLKVSEDLMEAKAIIFHGRSGAKPEEVFRALRQAYILKGIRKKNIEKVIRTRYEGYFEIARGVEAIDDSPGYVDKMFQEDEHKEFAKMMELLTIDTRAVKDINIADRNQLLMRIGDIVIGSDGYRVDGTTLPKQELSHAAAGIQLGPNVYTSDSGQEIYSKASGHIVWNGEKNYLDVEPIYIVDGNVDYSEGNIIGFVGKVLIKGDVKAKFSVVAEGDIEIHGAVEDAIVKSTTGNVFIAGGVVNRQEGYVQAKEQVHCMITTNGKIRANKIVVEKEAMNSDLEAEDSIEIIGGPGVVVGGSLSAKHLIKANTIGSERWVSTTVRVGDVSDLKSKLRGLKQSADKVRSKLREVEQIAMILEARKKGNRLTDSQEKELLQVQDEIPSLEDRLEVIAEEEEFINAEIKKRKSGRLEILKTMHPQSDVFIFDGHFMPETAENYTGFRCKEGEIVRYTI